MPFLNEAMYFGSKSQNSVHKKPDDRSRPGIGLKRIMLCRELERSRASGKIR